jgi:hypothetical protein
MARTEHNIMTLKEACSMYTELASANAIIDKALSFFAKNPDYLKYIRDIRKKDVQTAEFQNARSRLKRNPEKDRIFPMETVQIISHNTTHNDDIESAILHAGPSADEFARSLNALAITIGRDIYFRNGAYRPETEEGRTVLAHELTHVQQYEDKRITKSADMEVLEAEACGEEQKEVYDPDPYIRMQAGNNIYRIRTSRYRMLIRRAAEQIEEWVAEQKHSLPEEKYLALLCRYQQLIGAQ